MIKVILFDIDNTLLSFDEYVKSTMKNGFEKFGLGLYNDTMFSVFSQINASLWQMIEKGELTFEKLQEIRWNMVFEALGISGDGVAFEKYFREELFNNATPENGAMEALEYLKGKYTLCVASNGPCQQQKNRLRICGMLPYFSDLFISEEIGFSKPSEKFFSVCLSRIKEKTRQEILPGEVLIIGDSLSSDMAGGIGSGMKTCYYNPHKKSAPYIVNTDYEITSLNELKTIL